MLRIAQGRVYDPANGVDGEVLAAIKARIAGEET